MANQSIKTERVTAAANQINTVNNNINRAFDNMQNTAKSLGTAWKSPAGSSAQTKMYEIFKVNASRSNVLLSYIRTLNEVINPNYMNTEDVNAKLSDQFK